MDSIFWYGMFVLCGIVGLVGMVSVVDLTGIAGMCVAALCAVAYLHMGDEARFF